MRLLEGKSPFPLSNQICPPPMVHLLVQGHSGLKWGQYVPPTLVKIDLSPGEALLGKAPKTLTLSRHSLPGTMSSQGRL